MTVLQLEIMFFTKMNKAFWFHFIFFFPKESSHLKKPVNWHKITSYHKVAQTK